MHGPGTSSAGYRRLGLLRSVPGQHAVGTNINSRRWRHQTSSSPSGSSRTATKAHNDGRVLDCLTRTRPSLCDRRHPARRGRRNQRRVCIQTAGNPRGVGQEPRASAWESKGSRPSACIDTRTCVKGAETEWGLTGRTPPQVAARRTVQNLPSSVSRGERIHHSRSRARRQSTRGGSTKTQRRPGQRAVSPWVGPCLGRSRPFCVQSTPEGWRRNRKLRADRCQRSG
jgi:hypothetical protein